MHRSVLLRLTGGRPSRRAVVTATALLVLSAAAVVPSTLASAAVPGPAAAHRAATPGVPLYADSATTSLPAASPDAAAPASSAAGWASEPTAQAQDATGVFESVSCVTNSFCAAVGYNPVTSEPLAETWNGTRWAISTTGAGPAAGDRNFLDGVSCISTSFCTAVGFANTKTLAEVWDGRNWTVQATADASGRADALDAVSCTSASACTAVGYVFPTGHDYTVGLTHPLDETWNGSRWAVVATPYVAEFAELAGVACSAPTVCTAVGYSLASAVALPRTLAERWTGSARFIEKTPVVSDLGAVFSAVSCLSIAQCSAVGAVDESNSQTLAESWTTKGWTKRPTPNPARNSDATLAGVSCTTTTFCAAVGTYVGTSGRTATLTEIFNGKQWTLREHAPKRGSETALHGVSCSSASSCFAAGTAQGRTLAYTWSAGQWTIQNTPNPRSAIDAGISAVSCASAVSCLTVGGDGQTALAESWDGSRWSFVPVPNPTKDTEGTLDGVSCTSAATCMAVGYFVDEAVSEAQTLLAESWDGSGWTLTPTEVPTGAVASNLTSVSCTTTTCTAVGSYVDGTSGDSLALAELWNGTSWAIQQSPDPTGAEKSFLNGVSCGSSNSCSAVGDSYAVGSNTGNPLAEVWDGASWSLTPVTAPAGAATTYLQSVSCTSARACTAVGSYTADPDDSFPLAETWNGEQWTQFTTAGPSAADDNGSLLLGISCSAASTCTAVGYYQVNDGSITVLPYADALDASDSTVQSVPSPPYAATAALDGVSCTAVATCQAVGALTGGVDGFGRIYAVGET